MALVFFFNDTATTEIYTLSLHDALPISAATLSACPWPAPAAAIPTSCRWARARSSWRSEEHTSELQSRLHLVCRLLLEKKTPAVKIPPAFHAHTEVVPGEPLLLTTTMTP